MNKLTSFSIASLIIFLTLLLAAFPMIWGIFCVLEEFLLPSILFFGSAAFICLGGMKIALSVSLKGKDRE